MASFITMTTVWHPCRDKTLQCKKTKYIRVLRKAVKIFEMCTYALPQVPHLRYVFSGKGMAPDKQKVSTVEEWPVLQNAADVKKFLGLPSYCQRYILHFSDITKPLHKLLKKMPNLHGHMNTSMPLTY